MATRSDIEWTETTWNPITGCTKISPGCKHCYAERMAKRLQAMGQANYSNGFKVTCHPHVLNAPFKMKKSQMIFVNSMSDLFHEDIPLSFILEIFSVMNRADRHTFQVLTKRSERLAELANELNWSDNIWMGVTVENEKYQYRIDNLRQTPAKIKFLSLEPVLLQRQLSFTLSHFLTFTLFNLDCQLSACYNSVSILIKSFFINSKGR